MDVVGSWAEGIAGSGAKGIVGSLAHVIVGLCSAGTVGVSSNIKFDLNHLRNYFLRLRDHQNPLGYM